MKNALRDSRDAASGYQTRDTICIQLRWQDRSTRNAQQWLTFHAFRADRAKILSKIHSSFHLAGYSVGIYGTFSPLQTSRLPVQIDQSKDERESISRVDIAHYYFSTIFKFYCGIFRWSIWSAASLAFRELSRHIPSLNATIRKITRFIRIAFLVFVLVLLSDGLWRSSEKASAMQIWRKISKERNESLFNSLRCIFSVTSMTVYTIDEEDVSVKFCHWRNKCVLSKKRVFIDLISYRDIVYSPQRVP